VELTRLVGFLSEWMGAIAVAWIIIASPRFQRPQLGFLFPRREGIMALSLFVLITVTAFIIYSVNPPDFQGGLPLPAPTTNLPQAFFMAGLTLIPVVVALLARGQPVRSAGLDPARMRNAMQMGFALALLTIFLRNRVFEVLSGLNSETLLALLTALGIAIAEETTFRGYMQPRLSAWIGDWPGLVLTAALFAIWHLVAWAGRLPLETTLILVGLTFAQGLVLGWVIRSTGSVLSPAIYRAVSIWLRVF
jgi:membrane protease YdiL (CAAX protease family)